MTALLDALAAAGLAALGTVFAAPVIAAVAAAAARLAPDPRAKEMVWTLALVLCAAPTLIAPLAAPRLAGLTPAWLEFAAAPAPAPIPLLVRAAAGDVAPVAAPPPGDAVRSSGPTPRRAFNAKALGLFGAAALAAGLFAGAAIAARRRRRLARVLRDTAAFDDAALRADVSRRGRALGLVTAPELRRTPRPVAPFAHPGPPPAIVLPDALLADAEPGALAMVCGHELAHLKRRDHVRRAVERTVTSLFWFAPGVGFIAARLDDAREAVCDAVALETGALTRRAYARTLLAASRHAASPAPAGALAFISFGRRRNTMRFNLLLNPAPRAARLRSVAAVALLAALGGGLAVGQSALAAAYAGPGDAEHAAQDARQLADIRIQRVRADDHTATYEITLQGDPTPNIAETRRGGTVVVELDIDGAAALLRLDDGDGVGRIDATLHVDRSNGAYRAAFEGDANARLTLRSGRGNLTARAGDGTQFKLTLIPDGELADLDYGPPPAPALTWVSPAAPKPAALAFGDTAPTLPSLPAVPEPGYVIATGEAHAPAADSRPVLAAAAPRPAAAASPATAAFASGEIHAAIAATGPQPDFNNAVIVSAHARVTSPFGERVLDGEPVFHQGVDIGADTGTTVRAPAHGVVREIRRAGDPGNLYGDMIVVDHGDGWRARYTNLSRVDVKLNHKVFPGDVLGAVGDSSASSKGPHLHLELWRGDTAVDPAGLIELVAAR